MTTFCRRDPRQRPIQPAASPSPAAPAPAPRPQPQPSGPTSAQQPHPAQRPSQRPHPAPLPPPSSLTQHSGPASGLTQPRCPSQAASVQTLAQQHEFEVVDLRQSKTFVAVGKGLDFAGALVAATFVIGDEVLTLVDHAHPQRVRTPPFGRPRL